MSMTYYFPGVASPPSARSKIVDNNQQITIVYVQVPSLRIVWFPTVHLKCFYSQNRVCICQQREAKGTDAGSIQHSTYVGRNVVK